MRHWLITGVSTGLGRTLAEAALARGDQVVGTLRNPAHIGPFETLAPGRAHGILMDVTQPDTIKKGVAEAMEELGAIDVLVNNAGYGLLGAVEEVTDAEIRQQFEVNVFGLLAVTREVLPHMRKHKSGHIINISSMAGILASPGLGIYNASKFAVEGISEALAKEVAPLGIKVTLVEPGAFRTDWAGRSMTVTENNIADYMDTVGKRKAFFKTLTGTQPGDPNRAAQAIIELVNVANPPLRLALGSDAVKNITAKIDLLKSDLTAWEHVSRSTDFQ